MPNYTFQNLSPFDFEQLAKSIVETKYQKEFESFTSGRDGGVDLRCFKSHNRIIVQCKHYEKSGITQLKSGLKAEVEKLKKLFPSKYIIVTSLSLTAANKESILEIFSEFPIESDDIIDSVTINSILSKYPEIEKRHPKLWMDSASVLERIIHSDLYTRSEITKEIWSAKIKLWVKNDYYSKAINLLNSNFFCIISGIPGIGKTTMAEMLCLYFCKFGYEFIQIRKLKDFFSLLKKGEKQIFYYDDFLGATQFEEKEEFDDYTKILQILNQSTKFILTTREYIFNQGIQQSEKLSSLDGKSSVLKLSDYSPFQKAQILYNHLYFSNIPVNFCKFIIENKRYNKIINHQNYSPRLIEWMTKTGAREYENLSPENYYKSFIANLNNPKKIWDKAFNQHISRECKYILYTLYFLNDNIYIDDLRKISFLWLNKSNPSLSRSEFTDIFNQSLSELENSFIVISKKGNENFISFHNPSLIDYIRGKISENQDIEPEFFDLKQLYWDQKIYILKDDIIGKDKKIGFLSSLCENIFYESLRKNNTGSSYKSKTSRLSLISMYIEKYQLKELKQSFCNTVLDVFLKGEKLDSSLTDIMINFPIQSFTDEVKEKLFQDFKEVDTTEECLLYLHINKKINFLPEKIRNEIINKSIENDMDWASDTGSSSYDVQQIQESFKNLEKLCIPISDVHLNTLAELFEKKEEKEMEENYDRDDYEHEDHFSDFQDIEELFGSFEK